MIRTMPTITIVAALLFAFGCKKTEKQTPIRQPTATNVQKQAEMEVTKENMDKQLEKVEKEIKADVNAKAALVVLHRKSRLFIFLSDVFGNHRIIDLSI